MKKNKVSEYATWLLPGLQVKRWFILTFLGSLFLILGFLFVLNLDPIYGIVSFSKSIFKLINAQIAGCIFLLLGILSLYFGSKKMNVSILDAISPNDSEYILENLYKRRKLNRGPKIVAIGGGTGLSTILKGLKTITNNLTAVVTVGDDGGSSGRLRDEFGILPPGDIRNCIAALGDEDALINELFQYRFKEGTGLKGHSFGNLFLSVLCEITGDMFSAVKESSKVLAIRGRVLPSTLDDMRLSAEMEDGRIIQGESNIPEAGGKIKRLFCEPETPTALPEVIAAIKNADIILMGPGSLYTSVIPNLLIDEISKTISKSKAHKAYVCNVMTQPGETDNYTVSDHLSAIIEHAQEPHMIDAVLVNDKFPEEALGKYKEANQIPVEIDYDEIQDMGIKVVPRRLIEESTGNLVRHSPQRVARAIYYWYRRG